MKSFLLICISMLMAVSAYSEKKEVPLKQTSPSDNQNMVPNNHRGSRIPCQYIFGTVDFDTKKITVEINSDILSYELWDEEGESLIAAYPSDSELVEFMEGLKGVYQLQIVTDEYLYIGYVEL